MYKRVQSVKSIIFNESLHIEPIMGYFRSESAVAISEHGKGHQIDAPIIIIIIIIIHSS